MLRKSNTCFENIEFINLVKYYFLTIIYVRPLIETIRARFIKIFIHKLIIYT